MTNVGHNEKLPRFRGFICLPKMRFCVHNASFSMTLVDLPPFPFGLCCAPCVVWGAFPVVVFSPCAAVWLASAFPTSSAFRTSFVSGSVVCSSSQSRRSRWSRLQEPSRKKEFNFLSFVFSFYFCCIVLFCTCFVVFRTAVQQADSSSSRGVFPVLCEHRQTICLLLSELSLSRGRQSNCVCRCEK